ncbi:asparagine synthase (glutamine-hydrolyzing) [Paenibacillus pasadenensis]|uniref:asparagine synthase (glutamine-hydrolyzing) n=1 Tax=Paenibacillus pasadenensis TaxID=217090 RepID=UPI0020422F3A|nr:asparagine synthase (glutamine-hydrolyzing) [Paenibacillus pasadenensis]MCM3748866.1 asparagine synthase (glutamine-hydrolyzing) [Paenibacillus pasadenensis]
MCGIVAIYNHNGIPVNSEQLEGMTDIIAHRGPDDSGHHIDGHIGLGFRRLSIVDLEHGAQPLGSNESGVWLIFNGEIYNYKELREWLQGKGHQFHTESDSEVILRLYEETGEQCVAYLRGMFGFVIWDKHQDLLFAARDHFGIKPVYYCETSAGYMISSEVKSLLASPMVEREVDGQSFYHYLTFQYVPEPATMFKGIHKLMAGHTMTIKNGAMKIEEYYKPTFNTDESRSFSDLVEEARSVLLDSVSMHRNSDVSRGAFLSGGIDSGSLVGMLQRLEPTRTFSVGFEEPGYSELELSAHTAAYLGTNHEEISINAKAYLDELPNMIWHMDEPVADPSAAGVYFVSRLASQSVKVVFSGEGADEFFGGYNIYREPMSLQCMTSMPNGLRKLAGQLSELMPEGMKGKGFLARGSKTLQERYFGNAKIFLDQEKTFVLPKDVYHEYLPAQDITLPLYEQAVGYDDVTKMQYIDIHTWLRGNILMKADKMSMAHSLELRVPFLDTKVFEFASKIPTKYKISKHSTKLVLREAMKDFVSPDVQTRRKLGFPVPIRVWLRKEWYPWAKELISSSTNVPWIDRDHALRMLEDHREGKYDASRKLWTLLVFILWYQMYIAKSKSM